MRIMMWSRVDRWWRVVRFVVRWWRRVDRWRWMIARVGFMVRRWWRWMIRRWMMVVMVRSRWRWMVRFWWGWRWIFIADISHKTRMVDIIHMIFHMLNPPIRKVDMVFALGFVAIPVLNMFKIYTRFFVFHPKRVHVQRRIMVKWDVWGVMNWWKLVVWWRFMFWWR